MSILLPGDTAYPDIKKAKSDIFITKGLTQTGDAITATFAGEMTIQSKTNISINTCAKIYYPTIGDHVVGIVIDKLGEEGYSVDINSYKSAFLPLTAFEGATRKNQVILKKGATVFGRITGADKHMEPQMSCKSKSKEASVFGTLNGGAYFRTTTALSKRYIPFEIAAGDNGLVWISSDKPTTILTVWLLIEATFGMDDSLLERYIENEIESAWYRQKPRASTDAPFPSESRAQKSESRFIPSINLKAPQTSLTRDAKTSLAPSLTILMQSCSKKQVIVNTMVDDSIHYKSLNERASTNRQSPEMAHNKAGGKLDSSKARSTPVIASGEPPRSSTQVEILSQPSTLQTPMKSSSGQHSQILTPQLDKVQPSRGNYSQSLDASGKPAGDRKKLEEEKKKFSQQLLSGIITPVASRKPSSQGGLTKTFSSPSYPSNQHRSPPAIHGPGPRTQTGDSSPGSSLTTPVTQKGTPYFSQQSGAQAGQGGGPASAKALLSPAPALSRSTQRGDRSSSPRSFSSASPSSSSLADSEKDEGSDYFFPTRTQSQVTLPRTPQAKNHPHSREGKQNDFRQLRLPSSPPLEAAAGGVSPSISPPRGLGRGTMAGGSGSGAGAGFSGEGQISNSSSSSSSSKSFNSLYDKEVGATEVATGPYSSSSSSSSSPSYSNVMLSPLSAHAYQQCFKDPQLFSLLPQEWMQFLSRSPEDDAAKMISFGELGQAASSSSSSSASPSPATPGFSVPPPPPFITKKDGKRCLEGLHKVRQTLVEKGVSLPFVLLDRYLSPLLFVDGWPSLTAAPAERRDKGKRREGDGSAPAPLSPSLGGAVSPSLGALSSTIGSASSASLASTSPDQAPLSAVDRCRIALLSATVLLLSRPPIGMALLVVRMLFTYSLTPAFDHLFVEADPLIPQLLHLLSETAHQFGTASSGDWAGPAGASAAPPSPAAALTPTPLRFDTLLFLAGLLRNITARSRDSRDAVVAAGGCDAVCDLFDDVIAPALALRTQGSSDAAKGGDSQGQGLLSQELTGTSSPSSSSSVAARRRPLPQLQALAQDEACLAALVLPAVLLVDHLAISFADPPPLAVRTFCEAVLEREAEEAKEKEEEREGGKRREGEGEEGTDKEGDNEEGNEDEDEDEEEEEEEDEDEGEDEGEDEQGEEVEGGNTPSRGKAKGGLDSTTSSTSSSPQYTPSPPSLAGRGRSLAPAPSPSTSAAAGTTTTPSSRSHSTGRSAQQRAERTALLRHVAADEAHDALQKQRKLRQQLRMAVGASSGDDESNSDSRDGSSSGSLPSLHRHVSEAVLLGTAGTQGGAGAEGDAARREGKKTRTVFAEHEADSLDFYGGASAPGPDEVVSISSFRSFTSDRGADDERSWRARGRRQAGTGAGAGASGAPSRSSTANRLTRTFTGGRSTFVGGTAFAASAASTAAAMSLPKPIRLLAVHLPSLLSLTDDAAAPAAFTSIVHRAVTVLAGLAANDAFALVFTRRDITVPALPPSSPADSPEAAERQARLREKGLLAQGAVCVLSSLLQRYRASGSLVNPTLAAQLLFLSWAVTAQERERDSLATVTPPPGTDPLVVTRKLLQWHSTSTQEVWLVNKAGSLFAQFLGLLVRTTMNDAQTRGSQSEFSPSSSPSTSSSSLSSDTTEATEVSKALRLWMTSDCLGVLANFCTNDAMLGELAQSAEVETLVVYLQHWADQLTTRAQQQKEKEGKGTEDAGPDASSLFSDAERSVVVALLRLVLYLAVSLSSGTNVEYQTLYCPVSKVSLKERYPQAESLVEVVYDVILNSIVAAFVNDSSALILCVAILSHLTSNSTFTEACAAVSYRPVQQLVVQTLINLSSQHTFATDVVTWEDDKESQFIPDDGIIPRKHSDKPDTSHQFTAIDVLTTLRGTIDAAFPPLSDGSVSTVLLQPLMSVGTGGNAGVSGGGAMSQKKRESEIEAAVTLLRNRAQEAHDLFSNTEMNDLDDDKSGFPTEQDY